MNNRINPMEYACYQNASLEQRMHVREFFVYNLEEIQSLSLRKEMKEFLEYRCQQCSLQTVIRDRHRYRWCVLFLNEQSWNSILEPDERELEAAMKKFLLKHGLTLTQQRKRSDRNAVKRKKSDKLEYLLLFYRYWNRQRTLPIPEIEKDVWDVRKLDHVPEINPVHPRYTLNFRRIRQEEIRNRVKELMLYECEYKQYSSIRRDLMVLTSFFEFLQMNDPKVQKLEQIKREMAESFLIYLKTESGYRQEYYTAQIQILRYLMTVLGAMNELPQLGDLFWASDSKGNQQPDPNPYTASEIRRFNQKLLEKEPLVARVLLIQQLLGTRIEDTLLLTRDCLIHKDGHDYIRIRQRKTRSFVKPIHAETAKKIEKLIQTAQEEHPQSVYVFLQENGQVISYDLLMYRVHTMIYTEDLRDDQGELFVFRTHRFRHTYGTSLAEMDLDDTTIARLLGHQNTKSVAHYRRVRNMELAKKTEEPRQELNDLLIKFKEARDHGKV